MSSKRFIPLLFFVLLFFAGLWVAYAGPSDQGFVMFALEPGRSLSLMMQRYHLAQLLSVAGISYWCHSGGGSYASASPCPEAAAYQARTYLPEFMPGTGPYGESVSKYGPYVNAGESYTTYVRIIAVPGSEFDSETGEYVDAPTRTVNWCIGDRTQGTWLSDKTDLGQVTVSPRCGTTVVAAGSYVDVPVTVTGGSSAAHQNSALVITYGVDGSATIDTGQPICISSGGVACGLTGSEQEQAIITATVTQAITTTGTGGSVVTTTTTQTVQGQLLTVDPIAQIQKVILPNLGYFTSGLALIGAAWQVYRGRKGFGFV